MPRLTSHGEVCYEQKSTLGANHPFWGAHAKWWPRPEEIQKESGMGCGACQQKQIAAHGAVDLNAWFEAEKDAPPDFKMHMVPLKELCAGVRHATELSIWPKQAYLAIAAGMPPDGVLVSCGAGGKTWWPKMAAAMGDRFKMCGSKPLEADIEPTELLFLDSHHTAEQTYQELRRHASKVSKYIVVHTVARDTFGEQGDDGGPGVMPGIRQWLKEGASHEWVVKRFDEYNHGLIVLSRDPADRPRVSLGVRSAWRFVRSKIKSTLNGGTVLPLPLAQERLDICLTCDKRSGSEGNNCSICKCFLAEVPDYAPINKGQPGKAFIPTESCPIGKWMDRPNDGVAMTGEQVAAMLEELRSHAESLSGGEIPIVPEPPTYSISGDLGDVICAMAVIKTLGGGKIVLYPSDRTVRKMSLPWAQQLIPLLESQPYIVSAEFSETAKGIDFDAWRERVEYDTSKTLLDAMSERFLNGARLSHKTTWLEVPPDRKAATVFHRSLKNRNGMDWGKMLETYGSDAVLVGLPDEHSAFEYEVGPIRFVQTEDLLGVAKIIAGADLLVCNQSIGQMIGYGLGKAMICELADHGVNLAWGRDNCVFVGKRPWQVPGA